MKRKVIKVPSPCRAAIPFGMDSDVVLEKMEGSKRRMKDGRVSFVHSAHNLELMRKHFPNVEIEMPEDLSTDSYPDVAIGEYGTSQAPPPYAHQSDAFNAAKDKNFFALLMEQGTGKTRVAIDLCGYHFCAGRVTGVIIVTFKGVHEQWVVAQIPEHLGGIRWNGEKDFRKIPYEAQVYTGKPQEWRNAWGHRLKFLSINFDSLATPRGRAALSEFCAEHKGGVAIIIDESHAIKSPHSLRTEACLELKKYARYRYILTGTPLPNDLEDEWTQSLFLSDTIVGCKFLSTFRAQYKDALGKPKNIGQFQRLMAPHCFRVTKEDALDLPPKIKQKFYFDLPKEALRVYHELKRNWLTTAPDGTDVTVQTGAVLLTRLQQITCGRLVDEDGKVHHLGDYRFDALRAVLNKLEESRKILIWSHYVADIEQIAALLAKDGAVTLYGATPQDKRAEAVARFLHDPSVKYLISNQSVGGTGHNMQGECSDVVYFSNSFNSVHRWQSEDRVHRIGTHKPVNYYDLIARATVDNKVFDALQAKKDFADLVLGALSDE